jgi:G patch domain-containing protein 1
MGYQPFVDVKETYNVKQDETSMTHLTSEARGALLGEKPLHKKTKSVFDLMNKDDRERIASAKKTLQTNPPLVKNNFTQKSSNVRAVGFQPFSKDPAKQARYDTFLKSRKTGTELSTSDELGFVCCLFSIYLFMQ